MSDFLKRFPTEADGFGSSTLDTLKLTEEPRIILLFTSDDAEVRTHYLDTGEFRGYVQCNVEAEGRCLLCDIRQKSETRIVLPVYDVQTDCVKAMLISDASSPHSLGPQLAREMERGDLDNRFLMVSRDYAKYDVRSTPVLDGAETGELAIADFLKGIKESRISLRDVIPRKSNRELAEVPEIERKALALGLQPQTYGRPSLVLQGSTVE